MKRFAILLFILYSITACTDNEFFPNKNDEAKAITQITTKNGILVFPNDSIFRLVMQGKIEIPSELNFISQHDIFKQIMLEEEALSNKLKNMEVEYPETIHSNLYNEKLKSGFIKITKYSDGTELYDLNLSKPQYSKILNEKGFYIIGNNIYQITSKVCKIWVNGNINDYDILAKTNCSDKTKGIYVSDSEKSNIQTRLTPFQSSNLNLTIKYTTGSTIRIYVTAFDKTFLDFPPVSYNRDTYIKVVVQKKNGSRWDYYTDFPHRFSFRIYIEDKEGNFIQNALIQNTTTGGNIYYSMYCDPEWLSINEVPSLTGPIKYTCDYVYLGRYWIGVTGLRESEQCYMGCECNAIGLGQNRSWKLADGQSCQEVSAIGD